MLDMATTPLPRTEEGWPSKFQFAAVDRLTGPIEGRAMVLTRHFNAPRGGPVFDRPAALIIDNIPPWVTSKIDPNLHRAGASELVVDGLSTSAHYAISDVALHPRLSDFLAASATIKPA